jgi:hypothetical protein
MSDMHYEFHPKTMDAHYLSIGRLTAFWASLEHEINSAIWHLANVQKPHGACITSQIYTLAGRLQAFISLVDQRGAKQSLLTKLTQFSKDAGDLGRRRNRIIHDQWIEGSESGTALRLEIVAEHKLRFRWKPVAVAKIDSLSVEVLKAFAVPGVVSADFAGITPVSSSAV